MSSPTEHIEHAALNRNEDLEALYKRAERDDGERDEARDELNDYALSVEIERHLVVTLSTGGPHEEIDAVINEQGEVLRASFLAVWGSVHTRTTISENDGGALWRYVAEIAELHAQED